MNLYKIRATFDESFIVESLINAYEFLFCSYVLIKSLRKGHEFTLLGEIKNLKRQCIYKRWLIGNQIFVEQAGVQESQLAAKLESVCSCTVWIWKEYK